MDQLPDFDFDGEESMRLMVTREDRIRSAFQRSKQSYPSETVVTPPAWFSPPQVPAPSRLEVRNIDFELNRLYFQRQYRSCLELALNQLKSDDQRETSRTVKPSGKGRSDHDGSTTTGNREKELLDMGIKCAIKLEDWAIALELAQKTREMWTSSPGLAASAGEGYILAGQPKEAISALLTALDLRGPLYPYLVLLIKAFRFCYDKIDPQDHDDNLSVERSALLKLLARIEIFSRAYYIPPRSGAGPLTAMESSTRSSPGLEEDAESLCKWCKLYGEDREKLLKLLGRAGNSTAVKERSVRSL